MTRGIVRNLLLAAVVFLPLFILGTAIEAKVRWAAPLDGPPGYQLSWALVIYLSMILQTLPGSLVHSAALLLIPAAVTRGWRRVIAVALSPLVPVTFVVLRLSGEALFSWYQASAAISAVAYGLTCATQLGRRERAEE